MGTPYLAPSLATLRAELNERWPNRDHTSDGWIGDTRHQATQSDHNPNARGSVDAIDVDEDGVVFAVVFAAIKRHPSARYVIYERKLYHRLRGWRAEPYSGVNPHDHHFHISIDQTVKAEQDRRPWGLQEDDVSAEDVTQGLEMVRPWRSAGVAGLAEKRGMSTKAARDLIEYAWAGTVAIQVELTALRGIIDTLAGALADGGSTIDTGVLMQRVDRIRDEVVDELAARLAS